jgi:hypothetical protein
MFTLQGRHRIRISTIDLHQPWPEIEKELLELFHQLAPHVDRSK